MNNRKPMNAEPETTCSDCGKAYQPDLATGLGGGCPHCLAQILAGNHPEKDHAGDTTLSFAAGDTFGGVEIIEPLARGGMGVVYKARQIKLQRVVAVKVIDPGLAGVPEFTQRFEREARALAVLNHPNVVQIFDYGQEDGLCYLVMEWVDGTTLREILSAGHLSPEDALRYLPQICDALEYAHAQGVVHRDIKPENILMDREGQLKIADFGIARMRGDHDSGPEFVTRVGQKMGTPQYMAPEQQTHTSRVDHRADLYALGVVFYEMLTGELPLGRFPNPSQRVKVDISLDEVVLKTLEHDPNRRYQRASEIKQALTKPSVPAPEASPANHAPAISRSCVSGFAWWSLAFAAISLLVFWEMTRPWILESPHSLLDERSFFKSDVYTLVFRPLGIAAVALAWIFGWLALWRIRCSRQDQVHLIGKVLALSAMITPPCLLTLLILVQILPLGGQSLIRGSTFQEGLYIGAILLAAAALLLIPLRGVIRRLRRYAFETTSPFPVKTAIITLLTTMLLGIAAWAISREWNEARGYGYKVLSSLIETRNEPDNPQALHVSNEEDANLWLEFVRDHWVLENNLFGGGMLEDLDHTDRFACTRINGEPVFAWMPPSGHSISLTDNRMFRDWYRYLWIHEFDLEKGVLKVKYEFPLRGYRSSRKANLPESEEALLKEKRIREKYGVEPDTLYRVEIPIKDLDQYITYGMDKEFWQSAERL